MHSLTINNSPTFQGSREIVFEEALANGGKIKKPLQDMLTQSQLQAITKSLMDDLDCISLPSKPVVLDNIILKKNLAEQAVDKYKTVK